MGLEPTNLLTASQALYQLSYAPGANGNDTSLVGEGRQPLEVRRTWRAAPDTVSGGAVRSGPGSGRPSAWIGGGAGWLD